MHKAEYPSGVRLYLEAINRSIYRYYINRGGVAMKKLIISRKVESLDSNKTKFENYVTYTIDCELYPFRTTICD